MHDMSADERPVVSYRPPPELRDAAVEELGKAGMEQVEFHLRCLRALVDRPAEFLADLEPYSSGYNKQPRSSNAVRATDELDPVDVEQLRRCLDGHTYPLDISIAGALVRLYALPLPFIVTLTTEAYTADGDGAYLSVDGCSIMLPPTLARLIDDQIRAQRAKRRATGADPEETLVLLPGRFPGRPRNAQTLSQQLIRAGLPTTHYRYAAMISNITDLPVADIAELFGLPQRRATRWARTAIANWNDYLAATY